MKVFVCYARVDRSRVDGLVRLLRDAGHHAWYDTHIPPGQDWREVLANAIRDSAAFLFAMSPDSIASEVCVWELQHAAVGKKPVLPVLLRPVANIPASVAHINYLDFTDGATPATILKLNAGLEHLLGSIGEVPRPGKSPAGLPAQVCWPETPPGRRRLGDPTDTPARRRRNGSAAEFQIDGASRAKGRSPRAAGPVDERSAMLGIDFGTTNSVVAVCDEHHQMQAVVVPNAFGLMATPSAVGLSPDGEFIVGQAALDLALIHPERVVLQPKRLFGTGYTLDIDRRRVSVEELAAQVLRTLRNDAAEFLGHGVSRAILTAPAAFDQAQIDSLRVAAELAGLDVMRIIAEPTAACLAVPGLWKQDAETLVAVYDLGGGTFDVSIVECATVEPHADRRGDGQMAQVVSIAGDTALGGLDFDRVIVDYCLAEFRSQTGIDLYDSPTARIRVREAAERAKVALSTRATTQIEVPFLHGDRARVHNLTVPMSRALFNELTFHLVERTLTCCRQAIEDSGLSAPDGSPARNRSIGGSMGKRKVDRLLLVGLATRTPSVREAASMMFGAELLRGVDPDGVVALGAATYTAVLLGTRRDLVLADALRHSLALELADGTARVQVLRNTTVPTQRKERFTTVMDGQTCARVHLLQGDHDRATENLSLSVVVLEGLAPGPAGVARIEVDIEVDVSHDVRMTVRDVGNPRNVRHVEPTSSPIFEASPTGASIGIAAVD